MIKLLVVDDSALMRRNLTNLFQAEGDFEIRQARNGEEAVRENREFEPDVVTLDINMPEMDGITCLSLMMAERPVAVIMVSSLTVQGALATFEALNLGAVDFVAKPGGTISLSMESVSRELIRKVREAGRLKLQGIPLSRADTTRRLREQRKKDASRPAASRPAPSADEVEGLLVIGASTGGPRALEILLTGLLASFPWPVVVAQHMPAVITKAFAERLNQCCPLSVVEAATAMPLLPGTIYIARGSADVVLTRRAGRLTVQPAPEDPAFLWHPSVERLGRSVLEHLDPARVTAVMLTGMGSDGSDAFAEIKRRGGRTIAESEASAVVYGMPAELVKKGGASQVLPVQKIAPNVMALAGR
jgi:two-component system chemotaxis response regulator CheB